MPKISVIMSVYNGAAHVAAAIDSILAQTFTDFEFLIIDDGSSDDTPNILKSYDDPRIKIHTQANAGLTKALNTGLELASAPIIARQDADDVSYPERLATQLALLEAKPDVVLVGSNADVVYPAYKAQWGTHTDIGLQKIVFFKTPFPHSTAMFRAGLGSYDESFKTAQDMELWMRLAGQGRLAMLPEPLIQLNIEAGSISRKRLWRQFYDALRARLRHNSVWRAPLAIYHSLRSLLITLLPPIVIRTLKS